MPLSKPIKKQQLLLPSPKEFNQLSREKKENILKHLSTDNLITYLEHITGSVANAGNNVAISMGNVASSSGGSINNTGASKTTATECFTLEQIAEDEVGVDPVHSDRYILEWINKNANQSVDLQANFLGGQHSSGDSGSGVQQTNANKPQSQSSYLSSNVSVPKSSSSSLSFGGDHKLSECGFSIASKPFQEITNQMKHKLDFTTDSRYVSDWTGGNNNNKGNSNSFVGANRTMNHSYQQQHQQHQQQQQQQQNQRIMFEDCSPAAKKFYSQSNVGLQPSSLDTVGGNTAGDSVNLKHKFDYFCWSQKINQLLGSNSGKHHGNNGAYKQANHHRGANN